MKQVKDHARLHLVVIIHLVIVYCFFTSPWWPLWYQVVFLGMGIVTTPLRNHYYDGKCPFSDWERAARLKIGDKTHRIHDRIFMEAYFYVPEPVFDVVEKLILGLLLLSILTQLIWNQRWWEFLI